MGRLTVRLPDSLHRKLDAMASMEGVSLNQLIVYTLAERTSTMYHMRVTPPEEMEQHALVRERLIESLGRVSDEAFEAYMAQLPPNDVDDGLPPDIAASMEAKFAAARAKRKSGSRRKSQAAPVHYTTPQAPREFVHDESGTYKVDHSSDQSDN